MALDAPSPLALSAGPLVWRNATLDWAFYDVGNLSPAEFGLLAAETTLEGAILVVHPNPWRAGVAIEKFEGFEGFRAAPGALLEHFTVAGVGSSDVGAAALARTLANHLGKPVGAIVAGYGAADLMAEAAGGWFFFGRANRLLSAPSLPSRAAATRALATLDAVAATLPPEARLGWDTATLLRLLREPERRVRTLLGHSKGCLALSWALNVLALADAEAFARLGETEVITAGAVQPFPEGLGRVTQILGALDWFGELNSDPAAPRILAPRAWHHLNTQIPAHLDLGAALEGGLV